MKAILTDNIIVNHEITFNGENLMHIMEKDGKAFACLQWGDDETGVIKNLNVSPDYRGKGIGTMMVSYIKTIAKGIGLGELWVSTRTGRQLTFFERLGFKNLFPGNYAFTSAIYNLKNE